MAWTQATKMIKRTIMDRRASKIRTAAVSVLLALVVCVCGCATAGAQKTELRTTVFENTVGAALAITGMAAGAYEGAAMSDGSGAKGLTYGIIGGFAGAVVTGGVYWLLLNIIGEHVPVGDNGETPKAEPDVLMPKD
jgi:hypothetical protein